MYKQIIKNQIDFICFDYIQRDWTWNDVNDLKKLENCSNFLSRCSLYIRVYTCRVCNVYDCRSMRNSIFLWKFPTLNLYKNNNYSEKQWQKHNFLWYHFQCCTRITKQTKKRVIVKNGGLFLVSAVVSSSVTYIKFYNKNIWKIPSKATI